MIKTSTSRFVCAGLLAIGLAGAPMLDDSEVDLSDGFVAESVRAPFFLVQWRGGELRVSGSTGSREHEIRLLEAARGNYPQAPIEVAFEPLGIVPEHWADSTTQILQLLAVSNAAEATFAATRISVRSIVDDAPAWREGLEQFKARLPQDIRFNSDEIFVDREISAADLCLRAFARFETGPINFQESTIELRSSAYPRLERVIGLAKACDNSVLSVTGHTDSSGEEAWNLELSRQRAAVVGEYFVTGGIDPERLTVLGVGSAEPLSSNSTRYGRSLNRRIEIGFSQKPD